MLFAGLMEFSAGCRVAYKLQNGTLGLRLVQVTSPNCRKEEVGEYHHYLEMTPSFMNIKVLGRTRQCPGFGYCCSYRMQGRKKCLSISCCAPGTLLGVTQTIFISHQRNPLCKEKL